MPCHIPFNSYFQINHIFNRKNFLNPGIYYNFNHRSPIMSANITLHIATILLLFQVLNLIRQTFTLIPLLYLPTNNTIFVAAKFNAYSANSSEIDVDIKPCMHLLSILLNQDPTYQLYLYYLPHNNSSQNFYRRLWSKLLVHNVH